MIRQSFHLASSRPIDPLEFFPEIAGTGDAGKGRETPRVKRPCPNVSAGQRCVYIGVNQV